MPQDDLKPYTIRELIREKAELLRDVDAIGPGKAATELVELAAILASLNKEIADHHFTYNQKRVAILEESEGKASVAKIKAEATKEWKDWQDRFVLRSAVEEMMRAIKYYLRGFEKEYQT